MRADSGIRVVIDTNVWISAFLSKAGAPSIVVRRLMAQHQPVFSTATFAELEERLWLPKFDRYLSLDDRKALLHDAKSLGVWIDVPPAITAQAFCRDASDDKFIHTALAAGAPWLVTGDRDLLEMPPVRDLLILSPADALPLLEPRH